MERVAESWELSTHKDGESIVAYGNFKGLTLSEYIKSNGCNVLGKNAEAFDNFPILIKFIDAKEALSIQVHPDDEYSLKNNGEYGKTEMWYILDCDEDSYLYYGFKEEISKEKFKKSIEENTLLNYLNKVKVNKGDSFFINAGTVRAIGKGIVICEVQQNTNTTYRVYDYDRTDKDGNKRPLPIEQAIAVAETKPAKNYERAGNILAECDYFIEVWSTQEGQQKLENQGDKIVNYVRFLQANTESEKTSMRLKAVTAQLTEEGEYQGGATPFGYRCEYLGRINKRGQPVKDLVIDPEEARIVVIIFEKTLYEGYGSHRLAEYINSLGVTTHNGSRLPRIRLWKSDTGMNLISRRNYIGIYLKKRKINKKTFRIDCRSRQMFDRRKFVYSRCSFNVN